MSPRVLLPAMVLLGSCLATSTSASVTGTRAEQQAPVKAGAISGIVTDATTGRPIAGARVSLSRTEPGGTPLRMVTDARGRFVFANLPAAKNYFVDASGFGYAPTRYGWTAPGQSLATSAIRRIVVDEGQWVGDINIPLWRLANITGRVVDERGEPAVGVVVRASTVTNIAGQSQPLAGPLATTDDRGMYRLADLPPATYFVAVLSVQSTVLSSTREVPQMRAVGELATGGIGAGNGAAVASPGIDVDGRHRLVITNFATPPPPGNGQTRAYPAVFFPAANAVDAATPIKLGYGDNRASVDMQLQPARAVRVSGHIETAGGPLPRFLLRLMPKGSEMLGFGAEAATTQIEPDGTFTFLNVPTGEYTVLAQGAVMDFTSGNMSSRMPDAPGFPAGGISVGSKPSLPDLNYLVRSGQTEPAWGRMTVSVGGADIDDLVLPLHPTAAIRGRIVFAEGVTPPPVTASMLMFAQPANGDPSLGNPSGRTAPNDASRAFAIEGLLAGTYLLDPMTFGAMAPVSVMWDGRDVQDSGFDGTLGRDFDEVVVTLTNKFAEITGVVRGDKSVPAPGAVLVFPVDRERWTGYGWTPLRLQSAPAGSDGSYKVQRLSEGEYFLIAVDPANATAWLDPKFLEAAVPHASRLSVKWGEKATLDLKIESVVVK